VRARTVATLSVTMSTVEGDPIRTTYRSRTDGRVDVVTDGRKDRYGPRKVTTRVCLAGEHPETLEFGTCEP